MPLYFDHCPYIAIIGDIKSSKSLTERRAVQQRLETALDTANQAHTNALASRFMITLGDEFQGLLKAGDDAIWIIDQIERNMHPVQLRFGIGIGDITTDINPAMPFGADGPAYHLARQMINDLKASEKRKMEAKANIRIAIQNHDEAAELINSVYALTMPIKTNWTPWQIKAMGAYLDSGTQQDAAKALNTSQSSIQKALAKSWFYSYWNALEAVASAFSNIEARQAPHSANGRVADISTTDNAGGGRSACI